MSSKRTVIHPLEADFAFPNSLKGQRGCILPGQKYEPGPGEDYVRLVKCYFNWDELERTKVDGVERILQVTDERLAGCREKNIRFIPRVAIQWPNHGDHSLATKVTSHCASDMLPSTLDTPEFLARVRNLVEKMGEAWDKDPRIAYMEMGIYGLWGEEHEDAMSRRAQRNMAEVFHRAFPQTPCMVRYPRDCMGEGFGTYWDSFAHINEQHYAEDTVRFMDWRKGVMGGEVAHNWGDYRIQPGDDMNDTLTAPEHLERFLDYVFWQHNNHLGLKRMKQDERFEAAKRGLSEYQKRAGHRFILDEVAFCLEDGILDVEVRGRNVGASPLYYHWPLTAALLDQNRRVVWQERFSSVDVADWMPGDYWNFSRRSYDIPASPFDVHGRFHVGSLPKGVYDLALAIPDPSCGRPNVLFAIKQYYNGGWHPIGRLGIDVSVDDPVIPPELFDDMRMDGTICY